MVPRSVATAVNQKLHCRHVERACMWVAHKDWFREELTFMAAVYIRPTTLFLDENVESKTSNHLSYERNGPQANVGLCLAGNSKGDSFPRISDHKYRYVSDLTIVVVLVVLPNVMPG